MTRMFSIVLIVAFCLVFSAYAGDILVIPSTSSSSTDAASRSSLLQLREVAVLPKHNWNVDRNAVPWSSLPRLSNVAIDADDATDNTVTITSHDMQTGDGPFTFSLIQGSNASGIAGNVNYYLRVLDANRVQLYMDYATAMLGVNSVLDPNGQLTAGSNAIEGVTSNTCTHDGTTVCTEHTTCSAAAPSAPNDPPSICYMAPQPIAFQSPGDQGEFVIYPTNMSQSRGMNNNTGGTGRDGSDCSPTGSNCFWGASFTTGSASDTTSFGTIAYAGGKDGYHNGDIACGLQGLHCRGSMTIEATSATQFGGRLMNCDAGYAGCGSQSVTCNANNELVIAFCGTTD